MIITITRFSSDRDSSLGILRIGEKFECFTLEDEFRANKVAAETRIPAGIYPVKLRTGSPMANRYDAKFADIGHRGMLWLQDVPDFDWIYFHIGNDDDDSEGCLLVGRQVASNDQGGGHIMESTLAYKRIYPIIHQAIVRNEPVFVHIIDADRVAE